VSGIWLFTLLLETIIKRNFSQLVSFPTHTKGNILDLVIVNNPERVLDVTDVARLCTHNHCMLEMVIAGHTMSDKKEETSYD
jgi:hypothetical protein